MVTTLRLALALVGCLTAVGCAAEPLTRSETPVTDDKAPPVQASTSSNDGDGSEGTLPVTPVQAGPATEDRLPPAQGGDEATPKAPAGTTPAPSLKTKTCTAINGEYTSLTTVDYTITDGAVKISKMTVLVKNKDQRDQNDADVFLTQSGGSEAKMFWTGDVLASGKTVEVAQAKTLAPKTAAKLRVETNFDKFLPGDPHEDCTINF